MNFTLLHKYLSGECRAAERQEVEEWLAADSRHQKFMDSLNKIWEVTPGDEFSEETRKVDARAAWAVFKKRVLEKPESTPVDTPVFRANQRFKDRPKHNSYKRKRMDNIFAYTAAAAAVVVIAVLFSFYGKAIYETPDPELAMQEIVTEKGQRTTFRLSDGTRVQLNADSRLEIPPEFTRKSREVYLQGEAFFEVTHNSEKPFEVHSENATTRVLGTKFGVQAYPGEDQVQVVVAEGKVALGPSKKSTAGDSKRITRNQIGVLSKDGRTRVSGVDDIGPYLGWKDGRLIFEDTPFREVKPRLERWYDIDIRLKDSALESRRLTASFKDEPMTEVLNVIALSMEMSYERKGRQITFRKN